MVEKKEKEKLYFFNINCQFKSNFKYYKTENYEFYLFILWKNSTGLFSYKIP